MSGKRKLPSRRRWLQACGGVGLGAIAGCLDELDALEEEEGNGEDEADLEFPPGVSEDGIEDGEELFETHVEKTTETAFTLEYEYNYTAEQDGEPAATTIDAFRLVAEPRADRVTKREFDDALDSGFDHGLYIDGDDGETSDGHPLTHRSSDDVIDGVFETASTYLPHAEADYAGLTEIEWGTVHELEITDSQQQHVNGELQDVSGSIYVDGRGRIHRYRELQSSVLDDQDVELEVTFTCSEFGTAAVTEPEWFDGSVGGSDPIEPGTQIELESKVTGWVGVEPADIEGVENPTLVLESGEEYEIGWNEGDGLYHNLELWDENDDVVGGYATEGVSSENPTGQWIRFTATDRIVAYVCAPHASTQHGEIEVV